MKDTVFPLLMDLAREGRQRRETITKNLSVLFMDVKGFSKMTPDGQRSTVDIVRTHARTLLDRHGGEHANTWGDAIVAGFEHPANGLECACKLLQHLSIEGITARIGMSCGDLTITYDPVNVRSNIDGPAMSEGAVLNRWQCPTRY